MYTLKLEWRRDRIKSVLSALLFYGDGRATNSVLKKMDLKSFLSPAFREDMEEVGATLKLDLSAEEINSLLSSLTEAIPDLAHQIAELTQAKRDIEEYLHYSLEAQREVRSG